MMSHDIELITAFAVTSSFPHTMTQYLKNLKSPGAFSSLHFKINQVNGCLSKEHNDDLERRVQSRQRILTVNVFRVIKGFTSIPNDSK